MVFKCTNDRNICVPSFYLAQQKLDECSSYTYLGHIICNDLSDNSDIDRQCRSIYAKGNSLIRNFYKCSDSVKVTLFKSYCSSLYTCELWCRHTETKLRKISVAYHGVLKKFLNYPRSTSNSLLCLVYEVPSFQELVRKYVYGFMQRLKDSDNVLLFNLLNSSLFSSSTLSRRWFSLLH